MNKICNGREKQHNTWGTNTWDYCSTLLVFTTFLILLSPIASQAKPAVAENLRIIYGGNLLGTIKPCG